MSDDWQVVQNAIGSTWTSDEATNKRKYREARDALARLREREAQPSEIRAIEFALEELIAYDSAVGEEDDAHERHQWTIRKLTALLRRLGEAPINA